MSSHYESLLKVVAPGETVAYVEVVERMKNAGLPTAAIGVECHRLAFRGHTGAWRDSEIISWREPFYDDDCEGTWTDGTMFLTRRSDLGEQTDE